MPEFVRVRIKSTGALIWIGAHEVNDSVEVLEHQPSTAAGDFAPVPKKNLTSTLPAASPSEQGGESNEDTIPPAADGHSTAGTPAPKRRGHK